MKHICQQLIFSYFQSIKCDTKEAGVAPKTLLSKFNMTLTNEDLNRLQEGEELNNQVTV